MFLRADQAVFKEADIQAVRSLEAEFSEAQKKAQKKELEKQLADQKWKLEVKVFDWVVSHPDFKAPDPEASEKTPEYMRAAAEMLRNLTDDEYLLGFADMWEYPFSKRQSRWYVSSRWFKK